MKNAKIRQRYRLCLISRMNTCNRGILPKMNRVFADYTGHGIEHSVGVTDYMYNLIAKISEISDLEIAYLIDAALLHDIGMDLIDSVCSEPESERQYICTA